MRKSPKGNSAVGSLSSATPEAFETGDASTGLSVRWSALRPSDVVPGVSPQATLLLTATKVMAEYAESCLARRDQQRLLASQAAMQRLDDELRRILVDPDDIQLFYDLMQRMTIALRRA